MVDRTAIIPLGGSQQRSDAVLLIETITNYIPVAVSPTIGGKKQLRLTKRRGLNQLLLSTSAWISAAIPWYGVPGTNTSPNMARGKIVYSSYDGFKSTRLFAYDVSVSTLGTFYTTSTYRCIGIQETLISNVPTLTLNLKNGASVYDQKVLFYANGGTLTEVTSAPFTSTIGRGVHLDGYYFVASTDGTIKNSDLNSISSVGANNSIGVQSQPDNMVGLAKMRNVVVAFGTKSIEFFQNAGLSSGSPLQRISNSALKMGCLHGRAIQELDETILFVSVSDAGVAVHMLEGLQAKKVSTPFIDTKLAALVDLAGFADGPVSGGVGLATANGTGFLGVVKHHGVDFAILCINSAGDGNYYGYSPALDTWTTLRYFNTAMSCLFQIGAQQFGVAGAGAAIAWGSEQFTSSQPPGKEFTYIAASTSTSTFAAIIRTVPMTHGTARMKYYKSARILCDVETTTTPMELAYSDDDSSTFAVAGTIDAMTNPPEIITAPNLGASRRRVWQITNQSTGGNVVDALELVYEIGPS